MARIAITKTPEGTVKLELDRLWLEFASAAELALWHAFLEEQVYRYLTSNAERVTEEVPA